MFILVKELLKIIWHCPKFSSIEIIRWFLFHLEDRNCWLGKKNVYGPYDHKTLFLLQCFRPGRYKVHNKLKLSINGIWSQRLQRTMYIARNQLTTYTFFWSFSSLLKCTILVRNCCLFFPFTASYLTFKSLS